MLQTKLVERVWLILRKRTDMTGRAGIIFIPNIRMLTTPFSSKPHPYFNSMFGRGLLIGNLSRLQLK
jgi:hypothetical protein